MKNWLKTEKGNDDIVLSTRIRVARNIKGRKFPHKLDCQEGREVVELINNAFFSYNESKENYKGINLWENDILTNKIYLENHLISPKLLVNSEKAALILNNEETVSIMINEEDHLRFQCITASLNLEEAYNAVDKLDDLLEQKLDYNFDDKLGYLTACPTNLGTGLRASIMLHLPAMTMNNEINDSGNVLSHIGMTIRGLYGEGSKDSSNIYQISNQVTLGLNEDEILNNLRSVVNQIINQENISREKLMKNYKYELQDKIYRSLGILKSAILLDSNECLKLLSAVRLGVEMDIIKDIDKEILNRLLVDSQPATLQKVFNKKLLNKEVNFNRAKLVRERLSLL